MARKKIIFIIVEGLSDEEALGVVLNKIYDSNRVYIHIMRCDITTEKGATPSNIITKVCDPLKQYAAGNHFAKVHFQEIIHLVDTDGAYISEDLLIEDKALSEQVYSTENIRTPNKVGIAKRNIQKSANLNKLASISKIWDLPYQVYYMSSNLDHVLYNKINSTRAEKEKDSLGFAKKYKDDEAGFISYISNSDFSVMTDYKGSWEHIKTGANSLKRYTNLGLCFKAPQHD
ncbi:MAG: hypothetical protein PHC40_04155 [Eubacteriales bacterium]|nr:hypothetical protein [Eubacteriales bacterium]